ncbi:MAG TPA: SIS domain-containing protein [Nitrososphaerales archaeon]|nr:SIS domain-containing protein [Nitrososphaerales archaeon]
MDDPFSLEITKRLDTMAVHETYHSWPELAEEGLKVTPQLGRGDYRKVYVLGMGGSAAGGDVLASWLFARHGIELEVCKGAVPAWDMSRCLAIACSASGNTEETLSMMQTAMARHATVVSMSYGGSLQSESARAGVPHIQMPKVVAPRYMLPFMVFACLRVLDSAVGLSSSDEAREAVSQMKTIRGEIDPGAALEVNPSKRMALTLLDKIPAIYGTRSTHGAGIRFKNAVNENSKKHATYNEMPESFHNEIEAWNDPLADFAPVVLRDSSETERESRLAERFVGILDSLGKEPAQVRGTGSSVLARLMTLIYELDMASYYLAIGNGRDPFPIPLVSKLKEGP